MNLYEKACEAVTDFVHENGFVPMTRKEVIALVRKRYPEITPDGSNMSPSDICFNRVNGKDNEMSKNFAAWPHALKYLGRNSYMLLGQDYVYTGQVLRKPNDQNGEILVFGEWFQGRFKEYNSEQKIPEEQFQAKEESFVKSVDVLLSNTSLEGKEREALTKIRVNQGIFRERLLFRYSHCCLCGVNNESLLIASHIKPWSESEKSEKVDVNNGLLLCPNHDKLFDSGLISFSDTGEILISSELDEINKTFMNIRPGMRVEIIEENQKYLKYHRDHIFKQ